MFSKHNELVLPDLSTDLSDDNDWKVGALRTLEFPVNVTAIAVEPIASLLAAGTADGGIHIFGRPGVYSKVTLLDPAEVRFLQFSVSTYTIVCIDGKNQLHVYDLKEFGRPKLVSSARFNPTNSITLSPSHTHVFVATQNGDIKTFDLTCLLKSPYNTPNLWKLYEEKMEASGVPSLVPSAPANAVECVIHPRNLDLLFVAYSGGVVLTGLTERSTIRAYELTLTPGAPGGAGHGSDDILNHRRMEVTSIAVHPSGHFFAVGHADGSIAFWAVEDDNKPLLVRTLDAVDVNLVDPSALDQKAPKIVREPIFKLSWSGFPNSQDPRGGDTVLTILGGLNSDSPPGITIFLLPPFNPPEPPSEPAAPPDHLHPFFRNAMRQSLTPKKTFFYETFGVVQDYSLIPRSNPHFSGNYDPYAILLIVESDGMKTVEAYQFPPPGFIQAAQVESAVAAAQDEQDAEPTNSGMLSPPPPPPLPKSPRHLNPSPLPLRLPVPLLGGNSGILGGQMIKLDPDTYQAFVKKSSNDHDINLKGGQAFADIDKASELKLSKYQPHRIMVTYNRDLSVQFFDISTQLLIPSANNLVEHEWPEPLPALNIHLDELFDDPELVEYISSPPDKIAIQSVQVAPEALECAIALKSGEIVVCHPVSSRPGPSSPKVLGDTEILLLDHFEPLPGSVLTPFFLFAPGKGPVETYALSDIGFLAASYKDGSLYIIDMRGPKIIFSQLQDKKSKRSTVLQQGHLSLGPGHGHGAGPDLVRSLAWTISPLANDSQLRVRLVAARQSGQADIYTLTASGNPVSWSVSGEPVTTKAMPDPIPDGIFVLDTKGARCKADRAHLSATFKNSSSSSSSATSPLGGNKSGNGLQPNVLITVGAKGARSTLNLNGEKVGKVEWGNKVGAVQGAQVVEHLESRALVVQTDRHDALIYSIPHLNYICTLQLTPITSLPLSIDESGDYLAWTLSPQARSSGVIHSATYGTLFDIRRAYTLPDIDFASSRGPVPPQPQPVSLGPPSVLGSWFSFNQTKTGEQIDTLLGGPDRPIPEKEGEAGGAGSAANAASGFVAGAAAVHANLYNKLTSAMNERGQMLGDLEERFNSLEEGSRSMVAQVRHPQIYGS
ncbi:hypothetical protein CVT26_011086 [Gymnopilus dilepis]|uniref:Lethal giant larvae (Lgl)-like C-terminal domain-containing protein n=1 Tax=Gymnopilus dilepis TaxID=231916 RepID=A0A409VJG7_9AGAR|nr:hypothetical protein CVT26_011086 [Gymnopilus dilepis]